MTYDGRGRLTRDENAASGFFALTRLDSASSFTASLTSALNRTTSYQVERLATGEERRVNTLSSGLQTRETIGTDGSRRITFPDGTTLSLVVGPDPRWGMQAPLQASQTIRTPGGLTYTRTVTRAATLTDPNNPLSLATLTDSFSVNGRASTSSYDVASRTLTGTSAAGRRRSMLLDDGGRVLSLQIPSLPARQFTYDDRGRPTTITQGSGADARTVSFGYDAQGDLSSITDPLLRTAVFERESVGRIRKATLPDSR